MKNTFIFSVSMPNWFKQSMEERIKQTDQMTGKPIGRSGYIQRLVAADIVKNNRKRKD